MVLVHLKNTLYSIFNTFLRLIYPQLCLYCSESLSEQDRLFCATCMSLIELINPQERCPTCFTEEDLLQSGRCRHCSTHPSLFDGIASAFDYTGPAATIAKKMKYSQMPYLSRGAGAYMATQFLRLDWPLPEIIVPVPMNILKEFDRGYNQSQLLAESFSDLMQVPTKKLLKRRCGDYSQAGLSRHQRVSVKTETIFCPLGEAVRGKIVLLIDDVITTGSTLQACGKALQSECPKQLYALSLCRAMS
jgi:competence protein ComFC